MNEKKLAYCEECDEDVEYVVSEEEITTTVKGDTFNVKIKVAHCSKCGNRVFPLSIAKENDLIIYDEYRRRHHLLTSKEIIAIRKKRGLSQVQLARLIECGEKNIARYETGTIQDRVFDKLLRLIDDDYYYYHYCEKTSLDMLDAIIESYEELVAKSYKDITKNIILSKDNAPFYLFKDANINDIRGVKNGKARKLQQSYDA